MACAMPHAMERSVARPTINARLPLRNPISFSTPAAGSNLHTLRVVVRLLFDDARSARSKSSVEGPAPEIGARCCKPYRRCEPYRARGVPTPHPHRGSGGGARLSPGARLDHQSLAFYQRVSGPHIVQPRERGHRHAVSAGDGTQRLPRTDSINDLALPATADICFRPIDAGGGEQYFVGQLASDLRNPPGPAGRYFAAFQVVDLGDDGD